MDRSHISKALGTQVSQPMSKMLTIEDAKPDLHDKTADVPAETSTSELPEVTTEPAAKAPGDANRPRGRRK